MVDRLSPTPAADAGPSLAELTALAEATNAKVAAIESLRQEAEASQVKLGESLTKCSELATSCQERVDAAKATGAELTTLAAQVQDKGREATETIIRANSALEALQTIGNTVSESAARIEGLKTQVEQAAQVAAQRSQHIENGRVYVDDQRKKIDEIANAAQQSATNAEAQHQASKQSADDLAALASAGQNAKTAAENAAEGANRALSQCEGHANTTRGLATVAQDVENRIRDYEARLKELSANATERLKQIESLLPGAASAGLASAFGKRREYFRLPVRVWQVTFIVSLLVLIALAWAEFGLVTAPESTLSWDRLGLMIVHRLPFMVPLIWLAFYAARKAALAQSVEEDYGFKETVSRSFEGFRKEMADLEGKAQQGSALERLCAGVLAIITNPPGRIYEKHPLVETPLGAAVQAGKETTSR